MEQFIAGIIIIGAGGAIIIFREKFIRDRMQFQTKIFGFKYGEKDLKAARWVTPLVGVAFIVMGILNLIRAFGIFGWE